MKVGLFARLCAMAGHSVFVLECPGSLDSCYSKLIQGGNFSRCVKCKLGSLSSYGVGETTKMRSGYSANVLSDDEVVDGLMSSSGDFISGGIGVCLFDIRSVDRSSTEA